MFSVALLLSEGAPERASATPTLTSPLVFVSLVLFLGATVFLWRARYIRRRSAYVTMAVLLALLIFYGAWVYSNPL